MFRKTMMLALACTFLLSAGLAAQPNQADACSCVANPQVEEEFERKTAVFSGTVKSVEEPQRGVVRSSADPVKIIFEVDTVWKGELPAETAVYTAKSSASCGYDGFTLDAGFLVFASGNPERLETGLCDLTQPLESAEEELAALGAGYAPAETGGGVEGTASGGENMFEGPDALDSFDVEEESSRMPFIIALVAVAVMAGAVIGFAILKRRRS